MFFNNLKIAFRSLRKNKIYTLINIFGLMLGVAASLLIFRIVNYELSFNKGFANYDRIYRVASLQKRQGDESKSVCIPIPAMDAMKNTVTQVSAFSRVKELWATITIANPAGGPPLKKFAMEEEQTSFFAESDFFDIFDLDWLAGSPATALEVPGSIVLTRSWANKCFGNWEEAIDKVVLIDNLVPAKITGVIDDLPSNVDFNFPFLVSYPTLKNNEDLFFHGDSWGSCSSNDQVYLMLHQSDQEEAASELLYQVGEEEYRKESDRRMRFHYLQPLSDLHFDEDLGHSGTHIISKTRLKVLSFIGILILLMACFNFINLATAQATLRAKEVGVRKTLGSRRSQLIWQFMSETGVIVLLAVAAGANLAVLASPLLKHISDVPDNLPFLTNSDVIIFLLLTTAIVTILAGLYPAISLSNFRPVKALNKQVNTKKLGGAYLNQSLVVLQFVIAQALIVGAIITINQLDYIRSQDLGFNKNLIYTFTFNSDSTTVARQNALRRELMQIPSVETVSFNSDQPLSGNTWKSNIQYASRPENEKWHISLKFCDEHYQKTYGINLLAGEWLGPSDTMKQAVLNRTAVEQLGIDNLEDVVGQNIKLHGRNLKIVGVTEDFHTHSFRLAHQPLLMTTRKEFYWEAGIGIKSTNISTTQDHINQAFDRVLPEQVFKGRFLDESIARFYEADNRLSATCKGFGFLAILISCLGLFGLATHAAAQRIKEIGIRKVLGASVSSIVGLLSGDFLKLVLIAMVIATPLAYYFMNSWLDNFVYRINIKWWVFVIAGIIAIMIAFITVGWQAVRAALANPVRSLRNE